MSGPKDRGRPRSPPGDQAADERADAATQRRWERRFVADAQRAEEVIALYRALGYEVRAEPVVPEDLRDECEDCRLVTLLKFQVIYTRKRTDR